MCIMPCAASGASHENALSMRIGLPSSSTSRSSGRAESRAARRRAACRARPARPCRRAAAGGQRPDTAACSGSRPGASIVPSSICSRCSARQVWKPLECAEMPRIAWNATGRPMTSSCARPCPVGPGRLELDRLLEGDVRRSRARAGGSSSAAMPQRSATARARTVASSARRAAGTTGTRRRPSGQCNAAESAPALTSASARCDEPSCATRSQTSGLPSRVAGEQPVVGGARRPAIDQPAARSCSARRKSRSTRAGA